MDIIKQLINRIKEEYILLTMFGPVQRKWLRFLRDNPTLQHKKSLGTRWFDGTYKACCLGQFGLMTGICKWDGPNLLSDYGSMSFPGEEDMIRYGFYGSMAPYAEEISINPALTTINDRSTWLDVYYTCINDPKGYFSKKV